MTDTDEYPECTCGDTKTLLLSAMRGDQTQPCEVHRPDRIETDDPIALNSDRLTAGLGTPTTNV